MLEDLVKIISARISDFEPNVPIYLDDVLEIKQRDYFVLSVYDNVTENVGTNIQNKLFFVDIAIVPAKDNQEWVNNMLEACSVYFNELDFKGIKLKPSEYQAVKKSGFDHVNFNLEFPILIEWSELNA